MKIEHFALQVADPVNMAKWYTQHFDMQIKRSQDAPPHMHFLMASNGNILFEIFRNTSVPLPDYHSMDPLLLHLAFSCENFSETIDRLVANGAKIVSHPTLTEAGDELAMLRDPWGLAIQLVKRREPMLG